MQFIPFNAKFNNDLKGSSTGIVSNPASRELSLNSSDIKGKKYQCGAGSDPFTIPNIAFPRGEILISVARDVKVYLLLTTVNTNSESRGIMV